MYRRQTAKEDKAGFSTSSPFIVGVGRSGTTLLRLMLDAHSEMAIPPETHFIPQVAKACNSTSDPRRAFFETLTTHRTWEDHRIPADKLRGQVADIRPFDLGEALRVFYALYAERFGKLRWGDKTPIYVRQMELIQQLLPEASFVHIIRDGRDVALSSKDLWFGPDSVEETARWWRSWVEEARQQAQNLDHYIEIRYEDLVVDTELTLKEVCHFVGLDWDPIMLDYHKRADRRMSEIAHDIPASGNRSAVRGADRKAIHALTSKPPQSTRVNRWKAEMSAPDNKSFIELSGHLLQEFGYETS